MKEELGIVTFEDFKNQNGITYWWASDLMLMLGYSDMKSFSRVIDRATKAFVSLNIPHYENIIYQVRNIDGIANSDFKLTRFACYLIAMNGDPKKPGVARAQAYFATQARQLELAVENNNSLDRLLIRDELVDGNKALAATAKSAKVEDYARFQNAGYLGMYNMLNVQLARRRGIKKEKILETMGRTELAANLFRVTQTEERIKKNNITGQKALEQTHFDVGRSVRNIVAQNTGCTPENLPQEKSINDVKKTLKSGYRGMKKIDKK